jgi:hypothetical protein
MTKIAAVRAAAVSVPLDVATSFSRRSVTERLDADAVRRHALMPWG